jgi:hypothetical protein
MSDKKELQDKILEESKKGNVVFATFDGLMSAPLDEFLKQPTEGILYDLNRDAATVLSSLDNPKWINDFAVGLVIGKLKEYYDKESQ